jgi:hypothetical protein
MIKELEDTFFAALDPESRKTFHDLLSQLAAYNDPRCAFRSAEASPPKGSDSA